MFGEGLCDCDGCAGNADDGSVPDWPPQAEIVNESARSAATRRCDCFPTTRWSSLRWRTLALYQDFALLP